MKLSPIRRANRLASIACVLLAALGTSALAAEPKPDILLKDKFVEVNVSFDAAIKADASLVKNLTTSGKAWAAKTFRSCNEYQENTKVTLKACKKAELNVAF